MRKFLLLGLFTTCAVGGFVQPADAGCTTDLGTCYQRAANVDSFWYRWAAGIDCELDYVECLRVMLIGS